MEESDQEERPLDQWPEGSAANVENIQISLRGPSPPPPERIRGNSAGKPKRKRKLTKKQIQKLEAVANTMSKMRGGKRKTKRRTRRKNKRTKRRKRRKNKRTKRGSGAVFSAQTYEPYALLDHATPPSPLRSPPPPLLPDPAAVIMIDDDMRRGPPWMKNKIRNWLEEQRRDERRITRERYEEFIQRVETWNHQPHIQRLREREQRERDREQRERVQNRLNPPPSSGGVRRKRKGTKRKGTKRKGY